MTMKPIDPSLLSEVWPERQRLWVRELGRVRLGVEPIPQQLKRYEGVAWVITIVAGGMGLFIAALFTAFKSPGTGLIVSGLLFVPVIVSAWLGYWKMESRAIAYLREKAEVDRAIDGKKAGLDRDF